MAACGTKPRPRPLCALLELLRVSLVISPTSNPIESVTPPRRRTTSPIRPSPCQRLFFVARSVSAPAPADPWTNTGTKRRHHSPDSVSPDCDTPATPDILHPRPRFPLQNLISTCSSGVGSCKRLHFFCGRGLYIQQHIKGGYGGSCPQRQARGRHANSSSNALTVSSGGSIGFLPRRGGGGSAVVDSTRYPINTFRQCLTD